MGGRKRICFWIQAPKNDSAFWNTRAQIERIKNVLILQKNGYTPQVFFDSKTLLTYTQKCPASIDVLILCAHGNESVVGSLQVANKKLISTDSQLSRQEKDIFFSNLNKALKKTSKIIFDSCLAGNPSIQNNIARIASQTFWSATIYAPHCKVAFEPQFTFKLRSKTIMFGEEIDTVLFQSYINSNLQRSILPIVYRQGKRVDKPQGESLDAIIRSLLQAYTFFVILLLLFDLTYSLSILLSTAPPIPNRRAAAVMTPPR